MTSSVIVETTWFGNSLILTSTVPSNVNQISKLTLYKNGRCMGICLWQFKFDLIMHIAKTGSPCAHALHPRKPIVRVYHVYIYWAVVWFSTSRHYQWATYQLRRSCMGAFQCIAGSSRWLNWDSDTLNCDIKQTSHHQTAKFKYDIAPCELCTSWNFHNSMKFFAKVTGT